MPQPLPKKYAADVTINSAPAERQEQALNAANAIAQWSKLDAMMPVIFNGLVPGDPTAASDAFAAILNFKTRIDVLTKRAEKVLAEQADIDCLHAILGIYRSTGSARDIIAHHLWGTHEELPDGPAYHP